ncbi:MAG: quinone-dependent dihydroorotate dehydrogenase [Micrococcales bacterium]
MLYQLVFRVVFKRLDPEFIHHVVVFGLRIAKFLGVTQLGALRVKDTTKVSAFGLEFSGPFGLAAGFDKNAVAIRALGDLGFSHVEIGTVTALPQPGNPKPRLFRLPSDRALINRMGFNNHGAEAVATRLGKLRAKYGSDLPIIGVNIGKSKVTPVEDAASDYRTSARLLAPFADYLAVNVSSPNTPGLRSLQSVEALRPVLTAVQEESLGLPVLVKIAPDLANEDILAVAELAVELNLAGVIATNTTISRANLVTDPEQVQAMGDGGLSGAPLKNRSLEVLGLLAGKLAGKCAIVSVGGVETANDVQERIKNGATLVQGYTGFIYQGPLWARKLNRSRH